MERFRNFRKIENFFNERMAETNYKRIIGVAEFKKVYNSLMPIQKKKLEEICGLQFKDLMRNGAIICLGMAYPEFAIDCIDTKLNDGTVDKSAWNTYAREYHKINNILNSISAQIAENFGGIPIPATVEGVTVTRVEDYFGMTVSHRVIAENAGLGWRGKNELVVNERFSCALRFASIITNLRLPYGRKVKFSCGKCEACLEACPFLKNKDKIGDFRESCRKYIIQLGLEAEVCGKCIKACYRNSLFSNKFKLS
ncbi:MAG: hypothetical protein QXG27_05035 [Candidatus Bathyarchaeia archaeon]